MVFAASLFSRMGHAIAVFDWSLIVDQILLPKNGSGSVISYGVRKKDGLNISPLKLASTNCFV